MHASSFQVNNNGREPSSRTDTSNGSIFSPFKFRGPGEAHRRDPPPRAELREPPLTQQPRRTLNLTLNTLCFLLSASLLGLLIGRRLPADLDATCTAHTSEFFVVTQHVPITYSTVAFNCSFEKENIYRLPAGPRSTRHGGPLASISGLLWSPKS